MDYTINVDKKLKIIRYYHAGSIGRAEIGMVWKELLSLKEFTELKYNLLSDYRKSTFNLDIDDSDLISEFLYSLKPILNGKKQSIITDNPLNTALSFIFEDDVYEKVGFLVKTFSTVEDAEYWLCS